MFKAIQGLTGDIGKPQKAIDDSGIKRVFMILHGFYGNLFLSKFSTGTVDGGEDQGIANARRVWAYSLRDFDADTVKLALRRCQEQHKEFPPSLPQFMELCAACKPREVYRPPESGPALGMSPELRERIRSEHRQRATEAARKAKEQPQESGIDLLKQSIARAVAEAGGDEVAELLRLDRMLVPKVSA